MASYNLHLDDQQVSQEKEEDTLSLCDLPLHDHQTEDENIPATEYSDPEFEDDDFFAFPVDPVYGYYPMDVVFCGKSITSKPNPNNKKQLNSLESFKLGHCPSHVSTQSSRNKTSSSQLKSSKSHTHLIGLVKYHQGEMDLSEIRKRQGKRAPAAMFPMNGGGGEGSPEGVKSEEEMSKGDQSSGVMARSPFKCRSHLLNALSKVALGCIPHDPHHV